MITFTDQQAHDFADVVFPHLVGRSDIEPTPETVTSILKAQTPVMAHKDIDQHLEAVVKILKRRLAWMYPWHAYITGTADAVGIAQIRLTAPKLQGVTSHHKVAPFTYAFDIFVSHPWNSHISRENKRRIMDQLAEAASRTPSL